MIIDGQVVTECTYLGDSVYAGTDGFHLVLWLDNGLGPKNVIYLDPTVLQCLQMFVRSLQ